MFPVQIWKCFEGECVGWIYILMISVSTDPKVALSCKKKKKITLDHTNKQYNSYGFKMSP